MSGTKDPRLLRYEIEPDKLNDLELKRIESFVNVIDEFTAIILKTLERWETAGGTKAAA